MIDFNEWECFDGKYSEKERICIRSMLEKQTTEFLVEIIESKAKYLDMETGQLLEIIKQILEKKEGQL